MDKPWHMYFMAVFYILAGLNHFRKIELYEKIIPPFIPYKKYCNELIGFAEILFALSLFIPTFTSYASWSIIGLLVVVFPANIYMLLNEEAGIGIPKWILLIRLPIQIILIYWAYLYT